MGKSITERAVSAESFGHIPFYDNEIICGCGKKGCLETEVSGQALLRKVKEKMEAGAATILTKKKGELKLEDLIVLFP